MANAVLNENPWISVSGGFRIRPFLFEREELAFFEKRVWSVWTAEQQKIANHARVICADLSMNPQLTAAYEIVSNEMGLLVEKFTLDADGQQEIFELVISNVPQAPVGQLQEIDFLAPAIHAFELRNQGHKYGHDGDVDFETISFKLRALLLGLKGQVVAVAKTNYDFLEVTFRLKEVGPQSSFYLNLKVKNAFPPKA